MGKSFGTWFLGLVMGGMAGLAAALFLLEGALPPETATSEPVAAAREMPPNRGDLPNTRAARTESPNTATLESLDQVRAPDGGFASVSEALAAIPAPHFTSGQGVITGEVRGEDGRPVQDVVIRARCLESTSTSQRSGDAAPVHDDLELVVREAVDHYYWTRARDQEVVTDEQGRYRLEFLSDDSYDLKAYAEGWEIQPKTGRANRVRPGSVVDFQAIELVSVVVTIQFPDGTTPAEARLQAQRRSSHRHNPNTQGWNAENPVLRFQPGIYEMKALQGKGGQRQSLASRLGGWSNHEPDEFSSQAQVVTLEAGQEPPALFFQLQQRPGIRGQVVLPAGERAATMRVFSLLLEAGESADAAKLAKNGQSRSVQAGDLRYYFLDLKPGSYLVGAGRGRSESAEVMHTVEVAGNLVEQDLELPTLSLERCLLATVLDPDGEPVQQATFSAYSRDADGERQRHRVSLQRSENGEFWLLPGDTLLALWNGDAREPEEMKLVVNADSLGSTTVDLAPGQHSLTVQFRTPATLRVTVAGYSSATHGKELSVVLRRSEVETSSFSFFGRSSSESAGINENGEQTLGPVEPGPYEITLASSAPARGNWGHIAIDRLSLELGGGENTVTLAIPPLYDLVVVFEETSPDSRVSFHRTGESRSSGIHLRRAEQGEVRFPGLPAGDYQINLWADGRSEQMHVVVPDQKVVTFQPEVVNAMRVVIRDSSGPLARSDLQEDDLIIGIAEQEFEGRAQMRGLIMAATAEEIARIRILRNGATLDLDIPTRLLQEGRSIGGYLEHATR